jgi:release factor glutamine methyltransferase
LVDQVVDKLPQGGRVLDVGTGTGCIALAVKSRRSDAQVTGLDLSPEALQCAERNGLSLSLDVQWVQGDLTKDPPKGQWDMIVSNPPYIPMQERDNLDASVREFEPAMALHSPASDDIYFFRRLIQWAETLLSPGAWLLMEGHHVLSATVVNLLIEQGWSEVQLCKDDCGKPRMILAKRP